jgi:hypothetical protein
VRFGGAIGRNWKDINPPPEDKGKSIAGWLWDLDEKTLTHDGGEGGLLGDMWLYVLLLYFQCRV